MRLMRNAGPLLVVDLFVVWFHLMLAGNVVAQNVITTFAGTPKSFPSGTPVPALTAPLAPSRITVGPQGEAYFGDREANLVVRLNSDGTLAVVAGNGVPGFSGDGGPATSASLNQPSGFAVDSNGNLYIWDLGNARIRKVNSQGTISTIAGNGVPGFSGDGGPAVSAQIGFNSQDTLTENGHTPAQYAGSICVDSAGNLYIADTENRRVRMVNASSGIITTVAGGGSVSGDGGPATQANLGLTLSVAVDASGNLYIGVGDSVRIVNPGGTINTFSNSITAVSLAVGPSGGLYAATLVGVYLVTVSGPPTVIVPGAQPGSTLGDGGPAASASVNTPFGVAVDAQSNIFIADTFDERIREVNSSSTINTVAGTGAPNFFGDGGPAAAAGLSAPNEIAVDASGNVYIADTNNLRVRVVNTQGVISTFANLSAFGSSDSPDFPYYIALAADGGVYTANGLGIIKISQDGTVVTIAGGGQGPASDGASATSIRLDGPYDLAADHVGNVYYLNNTLVLRKIDSNGILSTPGGGVQATCATFLHQCIAIDQGNDVFLPGVNSVKKITPSGTVSSIPVSGISEISGIAVDATGAIYLSDVGNHDHVLKVTPGGTTTPFAGNNGYGYGGDGGPALQATLYGPTGLAVDSSGNLLIADNINGRIRKVFASSGSITFQVAPSSLMLTSPASGGSSVPQGVTLTPSVAGLQFTASANVPWLSVIPSAGSMPVVLQVTADPSTLAPGNSYSGAIQINAPNASPSSATINVTFMTPGGSTTGPMPGPLSLNTQSFSFSFTQGESPATSQLSLSNLGTAPANFTATAATTTGGNWLHVAATSGAVNPTQPTTLTITATPGNLAVGTYNGSVVIASADTGQQIAVSVTMAVSAPPQKILLSQTGLTFIAVAQGGNPLPQSFGIINVGQGSLSWTASTTTLSGGAGWLSINQGSGTVAQPYLDVSNVHVQIDASQLAAGDYYGQIQVKSSGASNSPQVLSIELSVLQAGENPGPEVSPTGLIFTDAGSGTPGSQDVMVGDLTAQAINFISGQIGTDFSFLPATADVQPNQPTTVHVYPNLQGVAPGSINRGTITLQFSDGTPRTVSILTVVAPSGAGSSANDRPRAATCPTMLLPAFQELGGLSVPAGWPATITVKVVDDCGSPMTTGSVVATFSNGDPAISLVSLQDGTWSGTWQPSAPADVVVVTVTATIPASNLTGTIQASIGVQASKTLPLLSGVPLSFATLSQGPFAPGDLMLIRGTNLADGTASSTSAPLQQQLSGAAVAIGGSPMSLLYVDQMQMIGVVPSNIAVNSSQQVVVARNNSLSLPSSPVIIAPAHPAILSSDGSGTGQGLVYEAVKGVATTLANSANPVKTGDTVIVYCTGLGNVDATGAALNTPLLTIAGQAAKITYAGVALAANYPPSGPPTALGGAASLAYGGLYQITATIPSAVPNGNASIVINSAGQSSPAGVTLAISGAASDTTSIMSINTAYGSAHIGQNDFIEIHGVNLASATAGPAALATRLGGASVTVNNLPALLYYVSPTQINALTPLDYTLGPVSVVVANNGSPVASFTANLVSVAPTFLRFDSAGDVTATHADGSYLGPPSLGPEFSPGKAGETIVTYAIGFGLPSTTLVSGSATQVGPLPTLPVCKIGLIPATVAFAGLNGYAGLYQLNITIPSNVPSGENSLSCAYAGQPTPAGTLISVQ